MEKRRDEGTTSTVERRRKKRRVDAGEGLAQLLVFDVIRRATQLPQNLPTNPQNLQLLGRPCQRPYLPMMNAPTKPT